MRLPHKAEKTLFAMIAEKDIVKSPTFRERPKQEKRIEKKE